MEHQTSSLHVFQVTQTHFFPTHRTHDKSTGARAGIIQFRTLEPVPHHVIRACREQNTSPPCMIRRTAQQASKQASKARRGGEKSTRLLKAKGQIIKWAFLPSTQGIINPAIFQVKCNDFPPNENLQEMVPYTMEFEDGWCVRGGRGMASAMRAGVFLSFH